jgi:hypothetical protein
MRDIASFPAGIVLKVGPSPVPFSSGLVVPQQAGVTPGHIRETISRDDLGNFFPDGRKACYRHAFLPRSSL